MEYVVFKGKGDILYTATRQKDGGAYLDWFGAELAANYEGLPLPSDPCDLEIFRDTLHEVLTEIIKKGRERHD